MALDAQERPPESMKVFYKKYQKANLTALDSDPNVLDLSRELRPEQGTKLKTVGHVDLEAIQIACARFGGCDRHQINFSSDEVPVYECVELPGKCTSELFVVVSP